MKMFCITPKLSETETFTILASTSDDLFQIVGMLEGRDRVISYTVESFGCPPMTPGQFGWIMFPKWTTRNFPENFPSPEDTSPPEPPTDNHT